MVRCSEETLTQAPSGENLTQKSGAVQDFVDEPGLRNRKPHFGEVTSP